MSPSSSITTATGAKIWRASCGGRRSRSAADPEYFRYPMIKRVAERSRAVIVHNPRAAALVDEHVRGAKVHEIPHLFALPADLPPQSEVIRWRAGLGVASHTFLVGVFGHLRESKRLLALLRAFRRARRAADMTLLVAGDFVSADLARAAEPLLRNEPASCGLAISTNANSGCAPPRWMLASTCVIPWPGETSGIAIRLMGLGKTVLVSAGEETSRFPEAACVRVDPGQAEEEMLAEYLVWLARCPRRLRAPSANARPSYIREHHAPARVAGLYWRALTDCYHRS